MRDIKFRAWRETEKHMYNWNNLLNQNLKNIFTITKSCGYNLMQYTGLHDKNGKEIYEGDIIHIHNKFFEEFNYLLQWNEEYLRYYLYSTDKKKLNRMEGILEAHLSSMINDIEVIGNIYDNPDLLEKVEG